ncbi:MAG: type III-A CRISPR-associated RAMP protein Csm5 [Deltaproteobacteria bacterium]|nr:type III-A CRISPR-associated RAMP protein Csm5 [Candidatus Tharpella aukensis]
MKQETFFFRLEVLSPLHIGCDEDYEPTNFVVDEQTSELINFNPLDFIGALNRDLKIEFADICSQGTVVSLLKIYQFMRRHAALAEGRRISISRSFIEHYRSAVEMPESRVKRELNKFRIERTAFQPLTGIPLIPGSSLKGVLRTAILNLRKPKYPMPIDTRDRRAPQELERRIFDDGSFATDPMRLIKVSDFVALPGVQSRIVYAVDKKKNPNSRFECRDDLCQILEVVESGSSFIGSITVMDPGSERTGNNRDVPRKPVTMSELRQALGRFFNHEKNREDVELKRIGCDPVTIFKNEKELLLRVGRHSGAECLTLPDYRNIRIMKGKGKKADFSKTGATTIWLAADRKKTDVIHGLYPFGWLSAVSLSPAELANIKEEAGKQREVEKQELKIVAQQRQAAEKARLLQEQAEAEEEKRVVAEQKVLEDQEAAKKESWGSLSSKEQDLMIVRGDDLAQEFAAVRVNNLYQEGEVWSKLDTAAPEQQKALALAFKESWQKEGNWKVKKAKKKQFAKVQKVKKILGELE